jgi:glycosyltransferase involved in cell wall biosynthesis
LLSCSAALVHPSVEEGFGMTPLEAMAAGVPAVVSNAGALPEVVGDAALLADPRDPGAWRELIDQACLDEGLRADLIARGRERAARFTWARIACDTVAVHREILDGKPKGQPPTDA